MFGWSPKYPFDSVCTPETVIEEETEEQQIIAQRLTAWFCDRLTHLTTTRAEIIKFRNEYIRRYANLHNLAAVQPKRVIKTGSYVLLLNAVSHKLDNRRNTPCVVIHHDERGYRLRHMGGMAAQLLPHRYPHPLLKDVGAKSSHYQKLDEDTLYVQSIYDRNVGKVITNGIAVPKTWYLITRVANPPITHKMWVDDISPNLKSKYDSLYSAREKATKKTQKTTSLGCCPSVWSSPPPPPQLLR